MEINEIRGCRMCTTRTRDARCPKCGFSIQGHGQPRYHVVICGLGQDCSTMDEVNAMLVSDLGWQDEGESASVLDRHTGTTEQVW